MKEEKTILTKKELQKSLSIRKPQIRDLLKKLSQPPKEIKFYTTVRGEIKLATTARNKVELIPFAQHEVEHWHYEICIKLDTETISKTKRKWSIEIAEQLIKKMQKVIETTTWYFGTGEVI
jgi:hypothetical protein